MSAARNENKLALLNKSVPIMILPAEIRDTIFEWLLPIHQFKVNVSRGLRCVFNPYNRYPIDTSAPTAPLYIYLYRDADLLDKIFADVYCAYIKQRNGGGLLTEFLNDYPELLQKEKFCDECGYMNYNINLCIAIRDGINDSIEGSNIEEYIIGMKFYLTYYAVRNAQNEQKYCYDCCETYYERAMGEFRDIIYDIVLYKDFSIKDKRDIIDIYRKFCLARYIITYEDKNSFLNVFRERNHTEILHPEIAAELFALYLPYITDISSKNLEGLHDAFISKIYSKANLERLITSGTLDKLTTDVRRTIGYTVLFTYPDSLSQIVMDFTGITFDDLE